MYKPISFEHWLTDRALDVSHVNSPTVQLKRALKARPEVLGSITSVQALRQAADGLGFSQVTVDLLWNIYGNYNRYQRKHYQTRGTL